MIYLGQNLTSFWHLVLYFHNIQYKFIIFDNPKFVIAKLNFLDTTTTNPCPIQDSYNIYKLMVLILLNISHCINILNLNPWNQDNFDFQVMIQM